MKHQDNHMDEKLISDYLSGKLSHAEAHKFEKAMQQDPLLAEAVEGFEAMGTVEFHPVKEKLKKSLGLTSNYWGLFFGSLILLIAIAVAVWYGMRMRENQVTTSLAPKSNTAVGLRSPIQTLNEETASVKPKILVNSSKTDSSMSFTFIMEKPNEQEEEETFVNITTQMIQNRVIPQKIEATKNFDDNEQDNTTSEDVMPKAGSNENGQEIYHIEDYKVVDYRNLRSQLFESNNLPGGIPPNTENEKIERDPLNEKIVTEVAYVEFLETAIKDFARGNFRSASRRFKKILSHYPDDANALFYGGMSALKTGNYAEAERLLKRSAYSSIHTFKEESEFYLAKTFILSGKIEAARSKLKSIVEGDSFYRNRAREELSKL